MAAPGSPTPWRDGARAVGRSGASSALQASRLSCPSRLGRGWRRPLVAAPATFQGQRGGEGQQDEGGQSSNKAQPQGDGDGPQQLR